ncbi:hypothetical protein TNCV_5044891 [Trichonephila clavipes]|uniref:Uncharacterized protein n=1 Tax=Trichonephila clavipes TaxID=2585209 RepID=A0A8X6WIV3_TRICX|nr:hypothetical protein TNCV_5044891 [Trichonephila clavipes]
MVVWKGKCELKSSTSLDRDSKFASNLVILFHGQVTRTILGAVAPFSRLPHYAREGVQLRCRPLHLTVVSDYFLAVDSLRVGDAPTSAGEGFLFCGEVTDPRQDGQGRESPLFLKALDCFGVKEIEFPRTATAGSDVVQSGRPIFDDFFQHLWPYIGNKTADVVFQMVKRLWLIRIDQ